MGTALGIISGKGGVGKSLLAVNLAAALGLGSAREVILIDLQPGLGTADLLLDLAPERSWGDLIPVLDELTAEQIRLARTEYRSGLDLMAAPAAVDELRSTFIQGLSPLVELLKIEYDLVIIDFPTGIDGAQLLVETIIVLLTPDAPSLRSTCRLLSCLSPGSQKVGAVINQCSPDAALKPDEIEDFLGIPVWGALPIDQPGIWGNISFGEPCALKRSSKFGRSVRELSARLLGIIDQEGDG